MCGGPKRPMSERPGEQPTPPLRGCGTFEGGSLAQASQVPEGTAGAFSSLTSRLPLDELPLLPLLPQWPTDSPPGPQNNGKKKLQTETTDQKKPFLLPS